MIGDYRHFPSTMIGRTGVPSAMGTDSLTIVVSVIAVAIIILGGVSVAGERPWISTKVTALCVAGGFIVALIGMISRLVIRRRLSLLEERVPLPGVDAAITPLTDYEEIISLEKVEKIFCRRLNDQKKTELIYINVSLADQESYSAFCTRIIPLLKKYQVPEFSLPSQAGQDSPICVYLPQERGPFLQELVSKLGESPTFLLAKTWPSQGLYYERGYSPLYPGFFPLPGSQEYILKKQSPHNIFGNSLSGAAFPVAQYKPEDLVQLDGLMDEISPQTVRFLSLEDFNLESAKSSEEIESVLREYRRHLSECFEEKRFATMRSLFQLIAGAGKECRADGREFLKAIYPKYSTKLPSLFYWGLPILRVFLEEELRLAATITAHYLVSHTLPQLTSILPIIYLNCIVPWKQRYDKASSDQLKHTVLANPFVSHHERKQFIQAVVERSCGICLGPEVLDHFVPEKSVLPSLDVLESSPRFHEAWQRTFCYLNDDRDILSLRLTQKAFQNIGNYWKEQPNQGLPICIKIAYPTSGIFPQDFYTPKDVANVISLDLTIHPQRATVQHISRFVERQLCLEGGQGSLLDEEGNPIDGIPTLQKETEPLIFSFSWKRS